MGFFTKYISLFKSEESSRRCRKSLKLRMTLRTSVMDSGSYESISIISTTSLRRSFNRSCNDCSPRSGISSLHAASERNVAVNQSGTEIRHCTGTYSHLALSGTYKLARTSNQRQLQFRGSLESTTNLKKSFLSTKVLPSFSVDASHPNTISVVKGHEGDKLSVPPAREPEWRVPGANA